MLLGSAHPNEMWGDTIILTTIAMVIKYPLQELKRRRNVAQAPMYRKSIIVIKSCLQLTNNNMQAAERRAFQLAK